MDGLVAISLIKLFFEVVEKGPGKIVPELISMSIPGSEILLAAEIMGINLSTNSTVRKDPSLQRYLNVEINNSINRNDISNSTTSFIYNRLEK